MNTLVFASIIVAGEAFIVWLAYSMGFHNGWLTGWDTRRSTRRELNS